MMQALHTLPHQRLEPQPRTQRVRTTPLAGLFFTRLEHVTGGQLCRFEQAAGGGIASVFAGLAAFRHRCFGHAALVAQAH